MIGLTGKNPELDTLLGILSKEDFAKCINQGSDFLLTKIVSLTLNIPDSGTLQGIKGDSGKIIGNPTVYINLREASQCRHSHEHRDVRR